MGRIPVDFSAAPSYDNLNPGIYEAVVKSIAYKEPTKSGGFAQLAVRYEITGGEYDKRQVFQNLSFSPKAVGFMAKFFAIFGFEKDALSALEYDEDADPMLLIDPDLTGEPCTVKIKLETYNDEEQMRVEAKEWLGRPAKSKKRRDDDDEDEPTTKPNRRRDEDEEERRPRKAAPKDEDDEEDEQDDEPADRNWNRRSGRFAR